ncbi:MAG: 2-dehydropantoate 2-reductase, partial [Pseudomonadota bacterium]
MKIAVLGAGGIGGYVGGRLAQAGHEVTLIARGAHLETLRSSGLRIETPNSEAHLTTINAAAHADEVGPVDLVLFTVKMADVAQAATTLPALMGPDTLVLTLQNGIDSGDMVAAHVGAERIVAGIIYLAAYIKEPGVITHPGGVHLLRADAMNGHPTMAQLFADSDGLEDLTIEGEQDARQMLWGKFVDLAAFSGITCLTRSPIGRVRRHPEALRTYVDLLRENVAIARAEGLHFADDHPERHIEMFRNQPYSQKSSMLVDLEAGKPLELPWLSGKMVALGAKHGIETPANQAVVAALTPFV